MGWLRRLRGRSTDDRGVTTVEYGIIAAGVGVAAISGLLAIQSSASSSFQSTTNTTGVCLGDACPTNLAPAAIPGLGSPPTLASVTPATGPEVGGGPLSLTGTNFAVGATVRVGPNACTLATVSSSTSMSCVVPGGTGTAAVVVTNPDGQSSGSVPYTYVAGATAPVLTSISPVSGPASGTGTLTLNGAQFASGATVSVGANACTSVVFVSDAQLTCTIPAGTGTALVLVRNPDAQTSGTQSYQYGPTVDSISPTGGAISGGGTLTVTGTSFVSGATVTVGGNTCTSPSVTSTTSMTCTLPSGSTGAQPVVVTNPNGESSGNTVTYTYRAAPAISTVSPTGGRLSGGNTLTVNGSDFVSGATVTVGGAACTSPTFVSGSQLTCTVPAGTAGAAAVQVTNPDGQQSGTSVTYTYRAAPTIGANGVSPNSGPPAGGTGITITGTGFVGPATVSVGGNSCTSVTVVSSTRITCTTPAGTTGQVLVTVTNSDGQSGSLTNGFRYTN